MTFLELGLSREVARAITEKGYENPTDIQRQALPILLNGHDLLAQSQTGTGKTAAFGLPIVTAVEHVDKQTQALILCPTRELSMQVAEEIRSFAKYKKLSVVSIYGGAPIDRQIKDLKRGADIVVATPGRLMDHIRRRTIRLNHTTRIVLDEADEMLNMGFVDDIREIFEYLPEERQMAFFSQQCLKKLFV
ncbi:DEAD/DEAH box helicase [Erysipelothrix sp. D19-032]